MRGLRTLISRFKIYRWSRALKLNQHQSVFQDLYASINGYQISVKARQARDAFEYTYGEIDFISFIALLSLVHPNEHTRFYDLGSGTGKVVVACAIVFDVAYACGIEWFNLLHEQAIEQKNRLEQTTGYAKKAASIAFIQGDFLTHNFSEATLIFINATAFIGEIWDRLSDKLAQDARGAIIITVSKKITSPVFKIKNSMHIMMSWGVATAYIYAAAQED